MNSFSFQIKNNLRRGCPLIEVGLKLLIETENCLKLLIKTHKPLKNYRIKRLSSLKLPSSREFLFETPNSLKQLNEADERHNETVKDSVLFPHGKEILLSVFL